MLDSALRARNAGSGHFSPRRFIVLSAMIRSMWAPERLDKAPAHPVKPLP